MTPFFMAELSNAMDVRVCMVWLIFLLIPLMSFSITIRIYCTSSNQIASNSVCLLIAFERHHRVIAEEAAAVAVSITLEIV